MNDNTTENTLIGGSAVYNDAAVAKDMAYQATTAEPRRSSATEEALGRQVNANETLHSIISNLSRRLEPVTAPRPETAQSGAADGSRGGSPVATIINESANSVSAACIRLQSIIDALEV